jgi:hypothetical protein
VTLEHGELQYSNTKQLVLKRDAHKQKGYTQMSKFSKAHRQNVGDKTGGHMAGDRYRYERKTRNFDELPVPVATFSSLALFLCESLCSELSCWWPLDLLLPTQTWSKSQFLQKTSPKFATLCFPFLLLLQAAAQTLSRCTL